MISIADLACKSLIGIQTNALHNATTDKFAGTRFVDIGISSAPIRYATEQLDLHSTVLMLTVDGLVVLLFGSYCFLRRQDSLPSLLMVAVVFQASSAWNIAGRGVQPYNVVEIMIVCRALANWAKGYKAQNGIAGGFWLKMFGIISVSSAFILPIVFSGMAVYNPEIGIDDGLLVRPPLQWSLNNAAQAGFLALHIITVFSVRFIKLSVSKTMSAYVMAFYIAVFFLFAQIISFQFGFPYPDSYVRNTPGYPLARITGAARSPGTFAEQSFAGAYFAMHCIGFMSRFLAGRGGGGKMLVALMATGIVASSGSIASLAICVPILLVSQLPFRYPWYVQVTKLRRWIVGIVSLGIPLVAVFALFPDYRSLLFELTVSKGDSSSFVNRVAADLYALQIFSQSYGIGVGLGSNRASSMLTSLLSTVGVGGVFCFSMFYFRFVFSLSEEDAWLRWSAMGLLLNMCFGISDVTLTILWMLILLTVIVTTSRLQKVMSIAF